MKSAENCCAARGELRALKSVGPGLEEKFLAVGIDSPRALITLRPRAYRDWRTPQSVAAILRAAAQIEQRQAECIMIGEVVKVEHFQGRVRVMHAVLSDGVSQCDAVWYGRGSYDRNAPAPGMRLFLHGRAKIVRRGGRIRLEITVLAHRILSAEEVYEGRIWPIYPATKELPSRLIARVIEVNFDGLLEEIGEEWLPPEILRSRDFPAPRDAWREVHSPTSPENLARARERITFDTFFELAFAAVSRRVTLRRAGGAVAMRATSELLSRFEGELPFRLTPAQARVIDEIWADMGTEAPMHRLLQGDVGCGKTVVAAAACLLAAQAGMQSALMAPTELLARQHAQKLAPLLAPFGVGLEYISGSQGARERREAEERLRGGALAVAVGTHALLTERVALPNLGLVIIDEQHRFGVTQRATLRKKNTMVHTLSMTATPIPRTLAQTRYADLDISVIDELPPGRTPVKTYLRPEAAKPRIYEYIRQQVAEGRQAYIVAPVIEEGDSALSSALAEAEELRSRVFPELRVGLVHGRLPARERTAEMERFGRGEIDVLIATTVVEVGVDVPNASIMMILEAHRFGLAQLHQLRGRVGRGVQSAVCILVAAHETERLRVLTRTTDGFLIADADLAIRGEGEFAGTAQAGVSGVVGTAAEDVQLYLDARAEAEAIMERDPDLVHAEHAPLRCIRDEGLTEHALLISS
jgi:ATP-dependent DNA helicase RecG